jgi:hypothetical protein
MNWHAESWALHVDFEANLWIGGGRALLALPQSWRAAKCLESRIFAVSSTSVIQPRCGSPGEFASRFTPSARYSLYVYVLI